MIRVLVVDDSPTVRTLLIRLLESDPEITVAGFAVDGKDAVAKAIELRPDLITMDIRMPRMDGVTAIRTIMRRQPTPIVVLCTDLNDRTLNISFNALKAGAVDVIEKPQFSSSVALDDFGSHFLSTIKLMSEIHVVRIPFDDSGEIPPVDADDALDEFPVQPVIDAVGICSSTGGPAALEYLFRHLPRSFTVPIVVVQHITEGFLHGLVDWLNQTSALEICVAEHGQSAEPGKIYFAPEDTHLATASGGRLVYVDAPPSRSHRPSGEILFSSMADNYGPRCLGVMLTGMGEDGVDGLETIYRNGGVVLTQDEATSVVFGMPRAVVERGVATEVLPIDEISNRIVHWIYGGKLLGLDLYEEG